MIIKAILIGATIVLAIIALRKDTRGSARAVRRLGGVALVLSISSVILWPSIATRVATSVGVGRGTDLLVYLAIMTFLFTTVTLYQRLHELERRHAELIRELALRDAAERVDPQPNNRSL